MSLLRLLRAGKSLVGARESGNRYRLLNGPALPKFGSEKNPFREPSRTRAENASAESAVAATDGVRSSEMAPIANRRHSRLPVGATSLPSAATSVVVNRGLAEAPATPELPKMAQHQNAPGEASTVEVAESKPAVDSARKEKRPVVGGAICKADAKPEASAGDPSTRSGSSGKSVGVVAAGAKAAARALRLNTKLNPLFGWARPKGGARALPRTDALVQGELSLDRVKVVRNDLSDSDLEIVPAKKPSPASAPVPELAATVSSPPRAWERVTSRLFGAGKT